MREELPERQSDFLTETIKKRRANKKKIVLSIAGVSAMALLFGLIACLVIVILSPILEERLFPKPANEVSFTEESLEVSTEEIAPEDMLLEEKYEPENRQEVLSYESQLLEMTGLMKQKVSDCQKWLVKVSGASETVSWLESTSTSSEVEQGAVIADNGTELLILVDNQKLLEADRLEVTFCDNTTYSAYMKGESSYTSLMVVAVNKEDIQESTLEQVGIAAMATSNNKSIVGSVVMALGSPNGVIGSACYGMVTNMGIEVNSWDANYKLMITDMYGSSSPSGFLVNLNGQIIGILTSDYNSSDNRYLLSAVGISELKKTIELLSNGKSVPYFGIKGTDVTERAHEEAEIPYGAYITNVRVYSPAMEAGIQPGDVIIRLNDKDISTMAELTGELIQYEAGSTVTVTIMRLSQGIFKETELHIVLDKQP